MSDIHTLLPSKYKINDNVLFWAGENIFIKSKIIGVRFTEDKVFYDILVSFNDKREYELNKVDSALIVS